MFTNFRSAARLAIAAISFASAAAVAQERQSPVRLAQADEGPMVITPRPYDGEAYGNRPHSRGSYDGPQPYPGRPMPPPSGYDGGDGIGRPYEPVPEAGFPPDNEPYIPPETQSSGSTFSMEEIKGAGHRFFGNVSMGLAQAIEYTFHRAGRPNGYILGEEAGGAVIAGVRYGDGMLYTKDAGQHRIYWQGPSVGYDFGAEGSKTMVLVYALRSPQQIYSTFLGVDGSAYLVGGVGVTFLARNDVILAPIRSGLGLRLGANVGYLKYTREPTWNPF
jgi:hypothetical protein